MREFGYAEVRARGHSKLLEGIQDRVNGERHGLLDVWMSHGDKVIELPPGFKLIATTDACPIAGMADEARRFYGVQFHPEVTHTKQGAAILSASCARSAAPAPTGTCPTTSARRSSASVRRSGRKKSSSGSRAASIPRSRRR